jgi:hypothetical protein
MALIERFFLQFRIVLKMYAVRVSVGVSANLNEVFVISISSSQRNTERVPFNIILLAEIPGVARDSR